LPILYEIIFLLVDIFLLEHRSVYISIRDGVWNIIFLEIFVAVFDQRAFLKETYIRTFKEHQSLWRSFDELTNKELNPITKALLSSLENDLVKINHSAATSGRIIIKPEIIKEQLTGLRLDNVNMFVYSQIDALSDAVEIIESLTLASKKCEKKVIVVFSDPATLHSKMGTIDIISTHDLHYFYGNADLLPHYFVIAESGESLGLFTEDTLNDDMQKYYIENMDEISKYKDVFFKYYNAGTTIVGGSLFSDTGINLYYGKENPVELHMDLLGRFKTVLDIGTGVGRLLKYFLARKGVQIFAMDRDEDALKKCKQNYQDFGNITYINKTFTEDSFPNQKFDVIVAYNSIYHSDYKTFMAIINRIFELLNQNGYFLVTLKTMDGNEDIYKDATNIETDKRNNTYVNCNYPDGILPHHFCTENEIDEIASLYSRQILKEDIPLMSKAGTIVQGKGYYMILQK
jgi:cyclopropane fatty-acyl-phospholipid synthase-like methyltransferase